MKKFDFKTVGTFTEAFERHLFGSVAALAKAAGCKAEFAEFADEAADGYCRAVLRASDEEALDEAFYSLWETYEIREWNAA